MHIKSIVAAAAITLIAGVGSVSADELSGDGTKEAPRTSFAMLDGIATEQMSVQELASVRGNAVLGLNVFFLFREPANISTTQHLDPSTKVQVLVDGVVIDPTL